MNKKALALVLALIISIPLTLVPMSGAFADSDIGISNSLLLSCFAWYTGTPGVDSAGIWYGSSFEEYSDSVESGVAGTTSFGVQCLLNTSGDYVDYQLNEYPFYANSWNSPILVVQLLLDRSSYGGPVEDLAYEFYTDSNDVIYEPFYQYAVPRFTLNNTDYVVMNLFFNIGASVNSGHPHIKIIYDGIPANFIAMGMRFMGYRYSPDATLTTSELYQIQTDLITSFNMARLLDAVGSDDSDIDLSTIENALASMSIKLDTIIANTDNVESLITSVNTALGNNYTLLNTFYQHYLNSQTQFNIERAHVTPIIYDSEFNQVTSAYCTDNDIYVFIPYASVFNNAYLGFRILYKQNNLSDIHTDVYFINNVNNFIAHPDNYMSSDYVYFDLNHYYNLYYYYKDIYISNHRHAVDYQYICFHFTSENDMMFYTSSSFYTYGYKEYNQSFYIQVLNYLKYLIHPSGSSSLHDDIADTTQSVSNNAQSVEQFETTYNTQLQDAHDDVDLSGYTISATSGMTYLKTYTHNAFTASNGLRVFMIYPIIFVLIGIFLRRFA